MKPEKCTSWEFSYLGYLTYCKGNPLTPESDWHLPFRHKNIKVMKNNRNGHHAYKEALIVKQILLVSTLGNV